MARVAGNALVGVSVPWEININQSHKQETTEQQGGTSVPVLLPDVM
jgi:hypothetical protein